MAHRLGTPHAANAEVSRRYTKREIESAVAISADLHGHLKFDEFVARHDGLRGAAARWRFCIETAIELEEMASQLGVIWDESHDYYLTIDSLIDGIIQDQELDITAAIRSALIRCSIGLR